MTSELPLSPIILSKLYAEEEKIELTANLNRDTFTIYQITDGTPSPSYCSQIIKYLKQNTTSKNHYYKCSDPKRCEPLLQDSTEENPNKYVVIEFQNPSSTIKVDNISYTVKKITFHVPTFHVVNNDNKYNNARDPTNADIPDINRQTSTSSNNIMYNCMEMEILCENILNQKLSISILCNTNSKDTTSLQSELDTVDILTDDGQPLKFYHVINKYILSQNKQQLSSGGYKDTSYNLDIYDILPTNKHFFRYNGTSFEVNPMVPNFYTLPRIVFKDSIYIPKAFYDNILYLTSPSNTKCSTNNNIQLNQLIDYQPEKHSLVYSDTNINFTSDRRKPATTVDQTHIIYIIAMLMFLLLIIILIWLWSIGMIQMALKSIFHNNPFILQILENHNI